MLTSNITIGENVILMTSTVSEPNSLGILQTADLLYFFLFFVVYSFHRMRQKGHANERKVRRG